MKLQVRVCVSFQMRSPLQANKLKKKCPTSVQEAEGETKLIYFVEDIAQLRRVTRYVGSEKSKSGQDIIRVLMYSQPGGKIPQRQAKLSLHVALLSVKNHSGNIAQGIRLSNSWIYHQKYSMEFKTARPVVLSRHSVEFE